MTPELTKCLLCKRVLPISEFGKNRRLPRGIHYYCRRCVNDIYAERSKEKLARQVRGLYDGRCVICNGVENLEIVRTVETKRATPRAMVLICSACKREGIPIVTNFLRACLRCNHTWIAKKPNTIVCPNCKSPYWHLPQRETRKSSK